MQNTFVRPLALVAALAVATPAALAAGKTTAPARAPESGSHHAIGLDMVRLIDNGQFEPNDGTLNLFYQGYLTKNTAWTVGYAWGDFSSIPELTYKVYNQGFQNGTFWQVGLASVKVDGDPRYDGDPSLLGAFGYERSPAEHLVISSSVKALVGMEHPATGDKDIIFLPSLSVLFTF